MNEYRMTVAAVLLMVLAACQSLGLAPAQTFDQKLAYAYGTHTAVLQAATAAVNAGSITPADGQAVFALAQQSRTLLDSARTLEATDATAAGNKLALAAAVLAQLQTFLQSRGVK